MPNFLRRRIPTTGGAAFLGSQLCWGHVNPNAARSCYDPQVAP